MPFNQPSPTLGNQYRDDRVLRSYLARSLPPEVLKSVEPSLVELGDFAGGLLYEMQLADRLNEPGDRHREPARRRGGRRAARPGTGRAREEARRRRQDTLRACRDESSDGLRTRARSLFACSSMRARLFVHGFYGHLQLPAGND